ncbi:hypothetical protein [uncultured Rhodoblastus sp.]|uniref:hypothetical protein n=1 Tax=uncultured Rhodoblastus sp. TaxID=543037 RepID=UPI0025E62BC8|nr:hypothetical protein [uncultured Rhodoblastus sp.]
MAHRDKFGRPTFGRKWVRRDEPETAQKTLPITLPLALRREEDSFAIEDGARRVVATVDFENDPALRAQWRLFAEPEAREIAQLIARLLTDVESRPVGATIVPPENLNAENDE